MKSHVHEFSNAWLFARAEALSSGREEWSDALTLGLRVRISRLSIRFSVLVGSGASRRRIDLGCFPAVPISEARSAASALLGKRSGSLSEAPAAKTDLARDRGAQKADLPADQNVGMVTIPMSEYIRLKVKADGAQSISYRELNVLTDGKMRKRQLLPRRLAQRILSGEHSLKVWRKYRNLTQAELAKKADTNAAYLSQIENGRRDAGPKLASRLADALDCAPSDLRN